MPWHFLAFTLIVLFFGTNTAFTEEPPIRLGAVLALTGPAEAWGKYSQLGIEMAIDEANQTGGIKTRKVELVLENSQSNPKDAVSAFKKLSEFNGLNVILGDVWSQLTSAMIPLTKARRTVLLSPTVVAASVDDPTEYFYTMGPRIELAKEAVVLFFKFHPNIKKIALFCWDNPWGNSYTKVWEEVCKENKIEIVYRMCNPSDFGYDYRTDVTKAVQSNPDAFIIAHHTERIIKNLAELQFTRPILSTSNVVEVFSNALLPPNLAEGVYFTDWPPTQEFQQNFKKRYDKEPILEAHDAYEITRAALRALSTQGDDFLSALRSQTYQGVSGPVDFSKSFSVNYAQATLMQVKRGKIVKVNLK